MPTSYSTGNHLHFLSLGAQAARSYAAELPREAVTLAARLEVMHEEIATLNARQEKAKQQLALLTRELKAKKTESMRERARLIRLAEATFGPRDPRIKEFRPATEGKVRTTRGPNAARRDENVRPAAIDAPERAAPPLARAAVGPEDTRGEARPGLRSRPAPIGSAARMRTPVDEASASVDGTAPLGRRESGLAGPEVVGREAVSQKLWMYPSPLGGQVGGSAFAEQVCPFGCAPVPRGDGERETLRPARERSWGDRKEE